MRSGVMVLVLIGIVVIAGCAAERPIAEVVPYGAWPGVGLLRAELDKPPPRHLLDCDDRKANYSGIWGPLETKGAIATEAPGFNDQYCRRDWRAYRARRQKLQAEYDYLTGPDYVQPEAPTSVE